MKGTSTLFDYILADRHRKQVAIPFSGDATGGIDTVAAKVPP